jgi:hypothetical protein
MDFSLFYKIYALNFELTKNVFLEVKKTHWKSFPTVRKEPSSMACNSYTIPNLHVASKLPKDCFPETQITNS